MVKENKSSKINPRLILERDFRITGVFDPHIASLDMRPKSNDPTESYDLAASVTFGSDTVEISIPERSVDGKLKTNEVVKFRLELFKAALVVDTAGCKFDPLFNWDRSVLEPIPADPFFQSGDQNQNTRINVETGKILDKLAGGPKMGVEHSVSKSNSIAPNAWYEIKPLEDNRIEFASKSIKGGKEVPLNGRLLDDWTGWRILPAQERDSGVLGRLHIREDWIGVTDPQPVGVPGKFFKSIQALLDGNENSLAFRRKAFLVLVTHLVAKCFQNASQSHEATLALDTVIVRPESDALEKARRDGQTIPVQIEGHAISEFLENPPGSEVTILFRHGVPAERLVSTKAPQPTKPTDRETRNALTAVNSMWEFFLSSIVDRALVGEKLHVNSANELAELLVLHSRDDLPTDFALRANVLMNKRNCLSLLFQAGFSLQDACVKDLTKISGTNGRYAVTFWALCEHAGLEAVLSYLLYAPTGQESSMRFFDLLEGSFKQHLNLPPHRSPSQE